MAAFRVNHRPWTLEIYAEVYTAESLEAVGLKVEEGATPNTRA